MSNRMSQELRQNNLLRERQARQASPNKQADLPLGEVAAERAKRREAVTSQRNAIVAKWLDAALGYYPKAASIASNCGISEAYLSQMRTGERTIPAHLLLDLLDYSESAAVLLAAQAERSGRFTVQPIRKIDPEMARKRYIAKARAVGMVHAALRAEVAAECGATEDDLDWALEDTDVRIMGGR